VGDRGYVIAISALMLLPLLAFTGYAIDLGAWYGRAAQLQQIADAAALAGAVRLPLDAEASKAAVAVLTKNGICTAATTTTCTVADPNWEVTMARVAGSNTRYRVEIRDRTVDQYFSSAVRDQPVDIARAATAERIKPVPMGSPRNFLGTNRSPFTPNSGTFAGSDNFWLSVSGYCAKQEHGDRLTPFADRNGKQWNNATRPHSCNPGTRNVIQNREYTADGYFYAIEFPRNLSGSYAIQLFDAAHCEGRSPGSAAGDSGSDSTSRRRYVFTVRANDAFTPNDASVLSTRTIDSTDANCSTYAGKWVTLHTISNPTEGVYYLQVQAPAPPSTSQQEGQNQFSLRVAQPSGFSPCVGDITTAGASTPYNADCPNVYGLTHMGVYANLGGTAPSFYLANVGYEHSGKTMEVELFDPAEGAEFIELLDPRGNIVNFTWEIACKDGSFVSEDGPCATGERDPTDGRGPAITNSHPVSGTGTQPWPDNDHTQDGKYSDRLLRLKVTLPNDMATAYLGNTWWRIRYKVAASNLGDRTTWSVRIKGDPVRLVPG
jgi:hypothetical protein